MTRPLSTESLGSVLVLDSSSLRAMPSAVYGSMSSTHGNWPQQDDRVSDSYNTSKASSYIAQYPVLGTVQSVLQFTSLTDLFTQTPSRVLWEASSHMLQLMREGCSYTYPPLSIARYSFIQLSELEQCRVKILLTSQYSIRTRVLVVESLKFYPWAIAL